MELDFYLFIYLFFFFFFLPFFTRETTFVIFVCFPAHQDPSEKGSTLNEKNLLPHLNEKNLLPGGANSFHLE